MDAPGPDLMCILSSWQKLVPAVTLPYSSELRRKMQGPWVLWLRLLQG